MSYFTFIKPPLESCGSVGIPGFERGKSKERYFEYIEEKIQNGDRLIVLKYKIDISDASFEEAREYGQSTGVLGSGKGSNIKV